MTRAARGGYWRGPVDGRLVVVVVRVAVVVVAVAVVVTSLPTRAPHGRNTTYAEARARAHTRIHYGGVVAAAPVGGRGGGRARASASTAPVHRRRPAAPGLRTVTNRRGRAFRRGRRPTRPLLL